MHRIYSAWLQSEVARSQKVKSWFIAQFAGCGARWIRLSIFFKKNRSPTLAHFIRTFNYTRLSQLKSHWVYSDHKPRGKKRCYSTRSGSLRVVRSSQINAQNNSMTLKSSRACHIQFRWVLISCVTVDTWSNDLLALDLVSTCTFALFVQL